MSQSAPTAMTPTRRYFEKRAEAFDRLYTRSSPATWWLRRGPRRSRELAVSVVARHVSASVLDVGCGPGRVAEAVIEAGAGSYTGVDFSPHMLELARARVGRFDSVELVEGDFLELDIPRTFDVVLALGLFDYLDEPGRAAAWMHASCGRMLVATFSRRDRIKTPIRRFHYELIHRCPLFFYTEADAEAMLLAAGFSSVEFVARSRRGFFVTALPSRP
jgi:SAM-dependent methyltransferase